MCGRERVKQANEPGNVCVVVGAPWKRLRAAKLQTIQETFARKERTIKRLRGASEQGNVSVRRAIKETFVWREGTSRLG